MTQSHPPADEELVDRLNEALAGKYRVRDAIGAGAQSYVFAADDLRLDRSVALKVMRPEVMAIVGAERFRREIQIEGRLQHPHILPVHETGEFSGTAYCVMPLVEGETLRESIRRRGQLPLDEALEIGVEVADALSHAHSRGFVHRDVKPGNIFLSGGHAVLADFGIARVMADAEGTSLTPTSAGIGTPAYISPEQATEPSRVDGRTDVYSLGCVLYEMLAGEPPYDARTVQGLVGKHLSAPIPDVRIVRATVPPGVTDVIERALAKNAADRFQTAQEFATALRQSVTATGRIPPASRATRRRTLFTGSVLVGAVVLAWVVGHMNSAPALDDQHVVLYPLAVSGQEPTDPRVGEGLAGIVQYALADTDPLRWTAGWPLVTAAQKEDIRLLELGEAARLARSQGARYFVLGQVLQFGDSVVVGLDLRDARAGQVIRGARAADRDVEGVEAHLALEAMANLLPALLQPGHTYDAADLRGRSMAALANFYQGDNAYRRSRFHAALEYYRRALAQDSGLALVAVRAAQTAAWLTEFDEMHQYLDLAVAHQDLLPAEERAYALAMHHHWRGDADSALAYLREAIAQLPRWAAAWVELGEVFLYRWPAVPPVDTSVMYRYLPRTQRLDSLAESAFARALALDSTYAPALFHLTQFAARRGDVAMATRLLDRFQQGEPYWAAAFQLDVMLRCVRDGPATVARREVERGAVASAMLLQAAYALAPGGAQLPCAQAAFRAALTADSSTRGRRWAALEGLQGVLVAQGKTAEAAMAIDSAAHHWSRSAPYLLLLAETAGSAAGAEADSLAEALWDGVEQRHAGQVWLLGARAATRGDQQRLDRLASLMAARRDSTARRLDSLVAHALAAQAAGLRGGTEALPLFASLRPTARPTELAWDFWESLGLERMTYARLLVRAGRYGDAIRTAATFDEPQMVTNLLFLRPSLELRAAAADSLGDGRAARAYRDRLARLRGE